MEPLEATQSFIEISEGGASPQTLAVVFQDTLEHLGFRHFALCSHVDPVRLPRGAVMLHNYPSNWICTYSERNLSEIDPVLIHAERSLVPFFWDSPDFRLHITAAQHGILKEAAHLGVDRGFTIPIHLPWTSGMLRASCSVVPDSRSIDTRSYLAAQLMAAYMHEAATRNLGTRPASNPQNVLTQRERQCLELAAHGKSDWAIGQLLSLSEHTVHGHLERAKRRLGVATRVQAVVCALQGRQISLGDVIRSTTPAMTSEESERRPQPDTDWPL